MSMKQQQSLESQEINILGKDMAEIYREFGIHTSVQPQRVVESSRSNIKQPYIRTLPLEWTILASGLPGKALHVGIVLWFYAGLSKSLTVKLTRSRLGRFGIHPETGRRALRNLEEARLVRVQRQGHESPTVTILFSAGLNKNCAASIAL
jgi:hypothetical protein